MLQRALAHCAGLTTLQVLLFGLLLASSIEGLTAWTRFGLGLQSTRDTDLIGRLTFGIRIHHGYVGVVLGLAAWLLLGRSVGLRNALGMVAVGLVVSDLLHHFCVLWPITGSPEFDLVYPRPPTSASGPR